MKRTSVAGKSSNPVWNEDITFKSVQVRVLGSQNASCPLAQGCSSLLGPVDVQVESVLKITVYGKNNMFRSDFFLGEVIIPLSELQVWLATFSLRLCLPGRIAPSAKQGLELSGSEWAQSIRVSLSHCAALTSRSPQLFRYRLWTRLRRCRYTICPGDQGMTDAFALRAPVAELTPCPWQGALLRPDQAGKHVENHPIGCGHTQDQSKADGA